MVKSPDISRETLAKMSNDELDFRESVKNSIAAKTESMNTHTGRKDLGTPSLTARPNLFENRGRSQTRVHVNRDFEILNGLPKDVVLRLIIK